MKIIIMSQEEVEEYSLMSHNETSAVISIGNIGDENANVFCGIENNIKDVLKLRFNDIDIDDELNGGIKESDARAIKIFVNLYVTKKIDILIVNCEYGQSRSAGVAAAIMEYLYNDTSVWKNEKYHPNRICYKKTLKELTIK